MGPYKLVTRCVTKCLWGMETIKYKTVTISSDSFLISTSKQLILSLISIMYVYCSKGSLSVRLHRHIIHKPKPYSIVLSKWTLIYTIHFNIGYKNICTTWSRSGPHGTPLQEQVVLLHKSEIICGRNYIQYSYQKLYFCIS